MLSETKLQKIEEHLTVLNIKPELKNLGFFSWLH